MNPYPRSRPTRWSIPRWRFQSRRYSALAVSPNVSKPAASVKKIGGAVGAAAGIGSGVALVLSGADIRIAKGPAADPVDTVAGGLAGGVLAVLKSGSAGCIAGAAFGDVIDEHVLDKYRCVECGHAFSQPA